MSKYKLREQIFSDDRNKVIEEKIKSDHPGDDGKYKAKMFRSNAAEYKLLTHEIESKIREIDRIIENHKAILVEQNDEKHFIFKWRIQKDAEVNLVEVFSSSDDELMPSPTFKSVGAAAANSSLNSTVVVSLNVTTNPSSPTPKSSK
jgi:hypothetical protein